MYLFRAKREHLQRIWAILPESQAQKPSPESGLNYRICAKFARQRTRDIITTGALLTTRGWTTRWCTNLFLQISYSFAIIHHFSILYSSFISLFSFIIYFIVYHSPFIVVCFSHSGLRAWHLDGVVGPRVREGASFSRFSTHSLLFIIYLIYYSLFIISFIIHDSW